MIKENVIREWILALPRDTIAKNNDIGTGTVTNIINCAQNQQEYNDIDLLRHLALELKEAGLELFILGFAMRIKKVMEQNDINEDQIEPIISDLASYCYKHNLSFDVLIQSGYKALLLEEKFRVSIEKIPEYISKSKQILDNLENQIQTQQSKLHGLWTESETLNVKLEKIKNEYSAIEPSQKLSLELDEIKQINKQQEETIDALKVKLRDREHQVLSLDGKRIELIHRVDTCMHKLSLCTDRLKWLNKRERERDNDSVIHNIVDDD